MGNYSKNSRHIQLIELPSGSSAINSVPVPKTDYHNSLMYKICFRTSSDDLIIVPAYADNIPYISGKFSDPIYLLSVASNQREFKTVSQGKNPSLMPHSKANLL